MSNKTQTDSKPQRMSVHLTAAAVELLFSLSASSSIRLFSFLNCASDQRCRRCLTRNSEQSDCCTMRTELILDDTQTHKKNITRSSFQPRPRWNNLVSALIHHSTTEPAELDEHFWFYQIFLKKTNAQKTSTDLPTCFPQRL